MTQIPASPSREQLVQVLERARELALEEVPKGRVATYIPELGKADPGWFGLSVHTLDGCTVSVGDAQRPFSLQSVSKVFALAAALQHVGDEVFEGMSVEPSGDAFHSIVRLEEELGRPRNPFVNAGAIYVSSRLPGDSAEERYESLRRFLAELDGGPPLELDHDVWLSECRTGHRNRALAHFMQHWGVLKNADRCIDTYFRQCSLSVTVERLARLGLFLANRGRDPLSGRQVVTPDQSKLLLALMTTCGLYDEVGRFAIDVGLPGKSGVSGGILAVAPGRMALASYGPALDARGNSIGGKRALAYLSDELELSIFG